MKAFANTVDVVVADGGSTDGSLDLAYLRENQVTGLLIKRGPGALSAQMRMAFAWALASGYQGVVVVDGNGKDDVSAIPLFVEALQAGYDHVQGSRFIEGGRAINTPVSRTLGLKFLHAPAFTLRTGVRHTDTTNGFRAYSARLLADPKVGVFRNIFSKYELHYHLDLEASLRPGYRTTEVPVTRRYPDSGAVPTKISGIRGNIGILATLARAITGRYRL
jgi:dolichol-phosphate mannosyltransferase